MEIIRAKHSGFCFGVKQGVERAYREVEGRENSLSDATDENRSDMSGSDKEKNSGGIYSYGNIIHNRMVISELKNKGLQVIDSIEDLTDQDKVIIRCHGVGEKFYREAKDKGVEIIDATCPYVAKIHKFVKDAYEEGREIVIVGDKKHPEVLGINGWCNNSATIINHPDEIKGNLYFDRMLIVAQTTIRKEVFEQVLERIQGRDIEIKNTICSATSKRQEGCRDLAQKVDAMVVIGDEASSNSKKLYEIAKKYCKNSYFISDISNFPLKELQKYNRIGIAAGASTPENAIKEVTTKMGDKITKEESMLDYMEEIEKSLRLPRTGELVTGKVHQVTDKEIIVNLGCKKDGMIPFSEITLEGEQTLADLFSVGDEITAKVLKTDDGDGTILLSKKKLEASEHWEEINKAFEDKSLIDVTVVRPVNGGVIATYKEVQGFIPLSQLSDKFVDDSSEFVGMVLPVKVTRVDIRRGKAIFSHKAKLIEEKEKILKEIWESINVGDIVEGNVMRFTDYGAFIDIGGLDGLLHISEISWGKLRHPQEVLEIGQTVNVKILSMNPEKGKVSLGLKQTTPEPWSVIDEKYKVGQIFEGKVVQIKEYGCFVELEPGLDGLVHISEVGHSRVADINEELKIGQIVAAKILEIDKDRRRISLSIKGATEKDEEKPEEKVEPVETVEETGDEIIEEKVEVADEAAEEKGETAEEKIETEDVTE